MNKDEYLQLLQSLQNDDYDHDEDFSISDSAWIPAVSPAKIKMEESRAANNYGSIDILKFKKDQIREALYKATNLKIGEFLLYIRSYHGRPAKNKEPNYNDLTMNITIYQEKNTTPSGNPGKMQYKMDFFQDSRFSNCLWLSSFDSKGKANNISVETVVNLVKYLQAIQNLTAFL
jgi:hypothetical protein